jgi:hypothetical protein
MIWKIVGVVISMGIFVAGLGSHIDRLSFEPCFNLNRTGEQSFRASLTGLGSFAHCDFARRLNSAGLKQE